MELELESSDSDEDILAKYASADARTPSSVIPVRFLTFSYFLNLQTRNAWLFCALVK